MRVGLGVAILAALAFMLALLTPAYWRNWQFRQDLETIVAERASSAVPSDVIRAEVRDRAAQRAIPVEHGDIRVTGPANGHLDIEVLYFVRVDLGVYTADLHFRPRVRQ